MESSKSGLIETKQSWQGQGNNAVRWQVCTEPGQVPSLVHDLLRTIQSSNEVKRYNLETEALISNLMTAGRLLSGPQCLQGEC